MGRVVPYSDANFVSLRNQKRQRGDEWNARDSLAKLGTGDDPLQGLGLGATQVVAAFSLVDDIRLEQVPRYRDQSTGEESSVYLLRGNIQPDFPQSTPSYPGVGGQFMAGLPIYIGAGNPTARSISLWLFLDESCRMIVEDYNSLGRFVPYALYAEDGSRDFPISIGGAIGGPPVTEKIVAAHAEYQPSLVTAGGATTDSIYGAAQITRNVAPNPSAAYAAHGPILSCMEFKGEHYIYCDPGNFEGNITSFAGFATVIGAGTTSILADGVCTGVMGISTGSGNAAALNPLMTVRLWAYNAGSPYIVVQDSFAVGAVGATVNQQLFVVTVPYPDYYRWEVTAVQTGGGAPETMNLRFWQVTASHLYRHLMAPQIESRWLEMQANRALGICCTVQNPTNKEYKGGLWLGYQSTLGEDWTEPLYSPSGASAYEFISEVNSSLNRTRDPPLLENGAYFFPLPSNNLDMRWKQPFERIQVRQGAGQSAADATYLVNTSGDLSRRVWAMINLQAPPLNVGTTPQQINYKFAMCGEYKSRNPFTELHIPAQSPEDWADGLETLVNMYQFYENPTHSETIRNIIQSIGERNPRVAQIAGVIKKWLPTVLKYGGLALSVL